MISKDKTKPPWPEQIAYRLNYQGVWTMMSDCISPVHIKVSVFERIGRKVTELIYSACAQLKYYSNEITFAWKKIVQC